MVREPIIHAEKDLRPYFKDLVETAVIRQNTDVTVMSQFYLVNLLSEFIKTDRLFEWEEGHYDETPLAILLSRALNAGPNMRIKLLKKIGDLSLYIAGFFSDHVDGKVVEIDYYISMGEGAFKNLSGIMDGEKTFSELYDELSDKFIHLVDILSEVRDSGEMSSNTELLRLYERWLKTGDPYIKERLEKEGIVISSPHLVKKH